MSIVVFGRDGQLGWELCRVLEARGRQVVGLSRADCDVTEPGMVDAVLSGYSPRLVVNCTAYNAVDAAEEDVAGATALNVVAVGAMAAAAQDWGAKFVTVSTDYVFGEGYSEPIPETEPANPLSVYGESKLEGERLALRQCEQAYVVRTTGLYSHRRHNFVKTMLKHGRAGTALKVVDDQFVAPTWVAPLARVLERLPEMGPPGVYHAVSHGGTSWYEYAQKIFEVFGVDADVSGIDQESWGAAAKRPSYSVLDNAKLRALGLDLFEPWDEALERFAREFELETLV